MSKSRIGRFLKYVEISTKLASLFPFLLGLLISFKDYHTVNWLNTGLFFVAMLLFDMTVTALNNYIDTRDNGIPLQFTRPVALVIIWVMLLSAIALGLILTLNTDLIILLVGMACFGVGILYTYGPAPISRMPLGEIFSGVFMGFLIPLLVVQVNAPSGSLIHLVLDQHLITLALRWQNLLILLLWAVTPVATIANIMLANNICDVEHDLKVSRLTLPFYIGRQNALRVFAGLYAAGFLSWLGLLWLGEINLWTGLIFITLIPVTKNIKTFWQEQKKATTFAVSLKNFLLQNAALLLAGLVSIWL